MTIVRYVIAILLVAGGGFAAVSVYQQSPGAGAIVGILVLVVVIPILLAGRSKMNNRAHVGEEPSSKLSVGVRQARALAMREDGMIAGAPPPRG
jgi:hypothetical protein